MNQFFYEQRGKEKLKELRAEGMQSQAANRARSHRAKRPLSLFSLVLIGIGALSLLMLVIR